MQWQKKLLFTVKTEGGQERILSRDLLFEKQLCVVKRRSQADRLGRTSHSAGQPESRGAERRQSDRSGLRCLKGSRLKRWTNALEQRGKEVNPSRSYRRKRNPGNQRPGWGGTGSVWTGKSSLIMRDHSESVPWILLAITSWIINSLGRYSKMILWYLFYPCLELLFNFS